jgi:ABC-2 type transport system permease protein
MAGYTLVVVALYPAFKNQTSLNSLSGSTAAALFGITGSLTSPGGWLNANIYANFLPLIMLLLTIGYGAACLAGQDENGTLALLTALPVRRRAIVLQKAGAVAVQAVLLAGAVTVCVVIGRGFQLAVSPADAVAIAAAVILMGLDFGLITMAAGAVTGRRGTALGLGAGLAAASYLPAQLPRRHDLLDPPRTLPVTVLLVGRRQPDQPGRQRSRFLRPGHRRAASAVRRGRRLRPGRPQLTRRQGDRMSCHPPFGIRAFDHPDQRGAHPPAQPFWLPRESRPATRRSGLPSLTTALRWPRPAGHGTGIARGYPLRCKLRLIVIVWQKPGSDDSPRPHPGRIGSPGGLAVGGRTLTAECGEHTRARPHAGRRALRHTG